MKDWTQEQIQEYNKMCAEFLGWKNLNDDSLPEYVTPSGKFYTLMYLQFESDWNWIMEVYIKINKLIQEKSTVDFIFGTETNDLHLNLWNAFENENCSKETVVQAIYEFLIWYNENSSRR